MICRVIGGTGKIKDFILIWSYYRLYQFINFYGENYMSKKTMKPVSLAVGTALVTSLAVGNLLADTDTNASPFAMNELSGGYMQLAEASSTTKPDQEGSKSGDKKN